MVRNYVSSTAPVRYNKDTEEFEMRCESCKQKNSQIFWPLTLEFWNPESGMKMCRACGKEKKAADQKARRSDPVYRERCVAATREIRAIKGHIYNETRNRNRRKNAA